MYDIWLFLTLLLFPPKKNYVVKPILDHFYKGSNRFSPLSQIDDYTYQFR